MSLFLTRYIYVCQFSVKFCPTSTLCKYHISICPQGESEKTGTESGLGGSGKEGRDGEEERLKEEEV